MRLSKRYMSKVLAIIGAGHLCQQIANIAIADNHYPKVIFFDDFQKGKSAGHEIAGKIEEVTTHYQNNYFDELIIAIGYNHLEFKKQTFNNFFGKIPFGKLIHSASYVDPTATVNSGSVIFPGCCIDANAVIGYNSILNLNCTVAHDSVVGAHSFLAPRVAMAGFVNVGENCYLGINATIIDNITIVSGTQLGGATVVIKNITEKGLYVGNPSKFIR